MSRVKTVAGWAACLTLVTGAAEAQVARVFVSVTGNDANVCSNIGTPCRTLGGGIAQVDPQGEVIVIDSGSYAGATITKSVKVNVAPGVVAFSGLQITVNPGAGEVVVLRGLTLKSATPGSGTGILHQSGTLFVENAVVDGWFNGIVSAPAAQGLLVKGSVSRNNVTNGILVQVGNTGPLAVDDSFFERNFYGGVVLDGGSGRVSNTTLAGNTNHGARVYGAGTVLTLQRCEVSGNSVGLVADTDSILRVSQSTITGNGTGISIAGTGALVESFGNSVIRGNVTSNTSGTITTVALQ
jgi:hypothetical protein